MIAFDKAPETMFRKVIYLIASCSAPPRITSRLCWRRPIMLAGERHKMSVRLSLNLNLELHSSKYHVINLLVKC